MNDPINVRSADFYSNLSPEDKCELGKIGYKRFVDKDQLVFQAGKCSEDVYILLDGRIKIYELSCEGREVILWFCFPGELFGLSEVMKRGLREVNAQSCSRCQVLSIRQTDFEAYMLTRPAVAKGVIDVLSCRLRELSDVLLNLASDDVTSRVIKLITRLSARYGRSTEKGIYLDIPLTHQEMADMIGTSRQTVSTVIGNLKRKGILRNEQRTIYIQDQEWVDCITGRSTEAYSTEQFLDVAPSAQKQKLKPKSGTLHIVK
jgi:CRP/FNR family transcriptional regulator, cyclic AMP receptor protein